ncbi:MAG TPA: nucleoside deaminase [Gemmatimonadales bacterium]
MSELNVITAGCPEWTSEIVDWHARLATDEQKMRLAIELARQNVLRGTGGPFGAAVFEIGSGALIAVGVNSVTRLNNSVLHAEVLALMLAEQRVGSYSLLKPDHPGHELFTSCDPCAMCLGAALWSGIRRLVAGADRADASAVSFDEGPVFPESYVYLESRGVEMSRGILRDEAAAVLDLYQRQGGPIYNA